MTVLNLYLQIKLIRDGFDLVVNHISAQSDNLEILNVKGWRSLRGGCKGCAIKKKSDEQNSGGLKLEGGESLMPLKKKLFFASYLCIHITYVFQALIFIHHIIRNLF